MTSRARLRSEKAASHEKCGAAWLGRRDAFCELPKGHRGSHVSKTEQREVSWWEADDDELDGEGEADS